MSQALGCLRPLEPEGMLRGMRRVTCTLEHAQVPSLTPPPQRRWGGADLHGGRGTAGGCHIPPPPFGPAACGRGPLEALWRRCHTAVQSGPRAGQDAPPPPPKTAPFPSRRRPRVLPRGSRIAGPGRATDMCPLRADGPLAIGPPTPPRPAGAGPHRPTGLCPVPRPPLPPLPLVFREGRPCHAPEALFSVTFALHYCSVPLGPGHTPLCPIAGGGDASF